MSARRRRSPVNFLKRAKQLEKDMKEIKSKELIVGIFDNAASRHAYQKGNKPGPTVGQVGFWHEYGVKKSNLPKRSFLHDPMAKEAQLIEAYIFQHLKKILDGNFGVVDALQNLGVIATNISKLSFDNNNWTPLKPATAKRKGSSKILVDTSALRNSIAFEVRDVT